MIRLCDIFFSFILLIILSPLFLVISLILKFTGEGEIFYLQKRVGKNYSEIKLIKFATMKKNSEFIGTRTLTVKNDPRILPIGGFLRDTKINELPQIINIFFGDMSFIGPRPQTKESFDMFPQDFAVTIKGLKPGLSGIGSIIFSREEEILEGKKNPVDFYKSIIAPYKGSLEVWFSKNNTLSTYLMLIFLTVYTIITKKNKSPYYYYNLPQIPKILDEYIN